MNNDLEQFSEETLIFYRDILAIDFGGNSKIDIPQSSLLALVNIVLAAKQAKPVAITDRAEIAGLSEAGWVGNFMAPSYKGVDKGDEVWLYTTPQPAHTEQEGWIKCSVRMPDVGEAVLTSYQGDTNLGWAEQLGAQRFFTSVASGRELPSDFWMPHPAAPKPESE